MTYVPAVMAAGVVIVIVDDPPEVTEVGLKLTETPAGAPVAERATVCALPEVVAVTTVAVVMEPAPTVPEAGLSATEKSLAGAVPVVRVQAAYSSALAQRPSE